MNAIIAYLPSGDKKVIIPSAHRYFIISSPCLPRERPSLFVAPTSTSCFLITVEEVIMRLCARPSFWGLINPQWSLCTKGRRQSPINIEPDKLLFDRHLRPVHVDKHRVIYLIFQSTKLQSDLRVEFLQVSGYGSMWKNFPSVFNSVDLCTINVTFSPRYFYRGTEALYGHLFPRILTFSIFSEENTNLSVSGKDEILARLLICRKRVERRDEAELWSRLVPLFKRGLGPFHSRRQPTNRPTDFPNSWSVIAKLQSVWKTDLASFGNLVNTPREPDFTSRV
ncbi:Putative carbonic anhydrase-like protein 2 [Trachymyrmex cornetzi]|uniref:Putative carbonic anhydrase-like protein 2 n=1 Tax=Trachymyrmex cornetzi TaxID=471704 RepID=A0A151J3B9_9HYME|nr:Putative carbonic anhydrase-like protein 2 [Trachymyrmex cornetzi]